MADNRETTTIRTMGDAFVVTAGFKYETLKNLKKYGKEAALTRYNEETKDPIFCVNVGKTAEISRFGVSFTGEDEQGYAQLTAYFPKPNMSKADKKAFLQDHLAHVVTELDLIQAQIEKEEKALERVMATFEKAVKID